MEVHEIEMRGELKPDNHTTAQAGYIFTTKPETGGGGQIYYGNLGYLYYYDSTLNEGRVLCPLDLLTDHVNANNPHQNSASEDDFNAHATNYNDPHQTEEYLLNVSSGLSFAQEEDSFLVESLSDGQYIIYFYRQYAMGSVSYGTYLARGNTQVHFMGWEKNTSDYIIGFKLWVRNMQGSSEELYYSMFGMTGVDPADCEINTSGGSASWDAGCGCEGECTCDSECTCDPQCTCDSQCSCDTFCSCDPVCGCDPR